MSEVQNILLLGVGGQGVMTLAEVMALAAIQTGRPVRAYHQSGLEQLGGPVTCHLRIGQSFSPKIPPGSADAVLSLELAETAKAIPYLKKGTVVVASQQKVTRSLSSDSRQRYPDPQVLAEICAQRGAIPYFLSPEQLGIAAEQHRANMVLLGIFCALLGSLPVDAVEHALTIRFPRDLEPNMRALKRGIELGTTLAKPSLANGVSAAN